MSLRFLSVDIFRLRWSIMNLSSIRFKSKWHFNSLPFVLLVILTITPTIIAIHNSTKATCVTSQTTSFIYRHSIWIRYVVKSVGNVHICTLWFCDRCLCILSFPVVICSTVYRKINVCIKDKYGLMAIVMLLIRSGSSSVSK